MMTSRDYQTLGLDPNTYTDYKVWCADLRNDVYNYNCWVMLRFNLNSQLPKAIGKFASPGTASIVANKLALTR